MTGLLTGTNKFKNFEIETNLKVSVLNSPYLEGRRYVYGRGDGNVKPSPDLSNYKIYDAAEWDGTDKQKVNLEEGFYVFARDDVDTNGGIIYKLSKDDGVFSIHPVCSKVDSSTNTPTGIHILMDYTNPNSIKTLSTETDMLDVVLPPNAYDVLRAVANITGLRCQDSSDFIVEQNPNLLGCIITTYGDDHMA